MGKSYKRNDGLMIDSSAIAMDENGHSLQNSFLHLTDILDTTTSATDPEYFQTVISDNRIIESMRVINASFTDPDNLLSDVEWVTGNGSITFTYKIKASTTTNIQFDLAIFQE